MTSTTTTRAKQKTKPQQAAEAVKLPLVASFLGISGALMRCQPQELDDRIVALLIGDRVLGSFQEIAMEFGVTLAEVEQWQRDGMPAPIEGSTAEKELVTKSEFHPPNARCCELLRVLQIKHFYIECMSILLGGDLLARTQAEVAKAFSVGLPTIKVWSSMGMPKPSSKGEPYNLIEILRWRIARDRAEDRG